VRAVAEADTPPAVGRLNERGETSVPFWRNPFARKIANKHDEDDATWDDLMYRVYVRQAIDAGRQDAAEGRLVDVAEVRRQFGLPE
jgi:hypothetical protein